MENYSLSDIATASGGNGMGGSWLVVLLFAMIFGGNGFGFGNRGCEQFATTGDVQRGFNQQDTASQLRGITYGIADSTYALNNAIAGIGGKVTDEARTIQAGLYDIRTNNDANTQKILDVMARTREEDLRAKVSTLENQLNMCGVVRYPMATTYSSGGNPFCACNGYGAI